MSKAQDLVSRKALEASPGPLSGISSLNLLTKSKRFRLTPPPTSPPVMTHKQFEHGSFTLHSGLVCFTHQEKRIVVHVNKVTGEASLPRGPCRVLPQGGRFGGSIGMESFNEAAVRMASRELGYQTVARGRIIRALLQPDNMDAAEEMWLMPPFVIDYGSEPVKGIAKVTAWFLAFMVGDYFVKARSPRVGGDKEELEEGELEEEELEQEELWEDELEGGELGRDKFDNRDLRVRGPDWVVKYMSLAHAAQRLPENEGDMIQKATAFVKIHMGA
ncbi:hypothetical protein MMC18_008762 [Xylographa bjoerkii]|nr:hypothetical protein [Xylographa bjoerkii]